MGEDAKAGDSMGWDVDSLRRAEGGGVLAGDDFWGEMDLARSVRQGTNSSSAREPSKGQLNVNN